jgi:hypothetical protein
MSAEGLDRTDDVEAAPDARLESALDVSYWRPPDPRGMLASGDGSEPALE